METPEIKAFDKLNDRQKDFVLNYIRCRVATKAYLEAYSDENNDITYETAGANATRLLKDAKIQEAIKEKINEIWNNKEKEIGSIFDEFKALGFSNISDIMENKDGVLTVKDFDSIDTRAIKKIKIKEVRAESNDEKTTEIIEVELHDKKGSLSELATILNLKKYTVDLKINGLSEIYKEIKEIFDEEVNEKNEPLPD